MKDYSNHRVFQIALCALDFNTKNKGETIPYCFDDSFGVSITTYYPNKLSALPTSLRTSSPTSRGPLAPSGSLEILSVIPINVINHWYEFYKCYLL